MTISHPSTSKRPISGTESLRRYKGGGSGGRDRLEKSLEGKKGEEGRKEGRKEAGVPGGFPFSKKCLYSGWATLYTRLVSVLSCFP